MTQLCASIDLNKRGCCDVSMSRPINFINVVTGEVVITPRHFKTVSKWTPDYLEEIGVIIPDAGMPELRRRERKGELEAVSGYSDKYFITSSLVRKRKEDAVKKLPLRYCFGCETVYRQQTRLTGDWSLANTRDQRQLVPKHHCAGGAQSRNKTIKLETARERGVKIALDYYVESDVESE